MFSSTAADVLEQLHLGEAVDEELRSPRPKGSVAAAGLGTRFLPATKAMPKEMLP
jgi:hypothetical protein